MGFNFKEKDDEYSWWW